MVRRNRKRRIRRLRPTYSVGIVYGEDFRPPRIPYTASPVREHSRLPCVKGAVILHFNKCKMTAGLCSTPPVFALVFGKIATFYRNNPSVKIGFCKPVLTAPLTQGSLGRSCASVLCYGLGAAFGGCDLHAPAGAVAQNDRNY